MKKKKFRVMCVDRAKHDGCRIYPRETVQTAIENAQSLIKDKRFFVTGKVWDKNYIDLSIIIGIVTKLELEEDDYVYATIQWLNTPAFKIFDEMIKQFPWFNEDDIFTTVALGQIQESYNEDEPNSITDDYELIGISITGIRHDFGGMENEIN